MSVIKVAICSHPHGSGPTADTSFTDHLRLEDAHVRQKQDPTPNGTYIFLFVALAVVVVAVALIGQYVKW